MKYSHEEFTKSQNDLELAKKAMPQAIAALDALETRVRDHFRELAKTFNYTLIFERLEREGELRGTLKPFEREGNGKGVIAVSFPYGFVSVTDDDGELHGIFERKGIPHSFEGGPGTGAPGSIKTDIGVASERLEEVLGEYRRPGERFPDQKGAWEEQVNKGMRRSRGRH